MSDIPKVTIIMATYNRAHFIVETLTSIQNQTFRAWECLIIDDGGTDNTKEVLTPILALDQRFRYVRRPSHYHKGLPGCRNYGLDMAQGDYIIFFDDDDIVHPQNLELSVAVLENNNSDFCHYQKMPFVAQKPQIKNSPITLVQSISKDDLLAIVTQKIGLASCTVLWKAACFKTTRFNETLLYAEEWECYIRMIGDGFTGIMIANVLYYNRKHSNSNTGEFYLDHPIRRKSYADAIVLVVKNLKAKKILTYSLQRYFIALSYNFSEFNLFTSLLKTIEYSTFEKIKWQLFYLILPLRLWFTRIKKSLLK